MPTSLEKLASLGSAALTSSESKQNALPIHREKNGFVAFESALWVLPSDELGKWNSGSSWRSLYNLPTEATCFASDLFGNQFVSLDDRVLTLEAETGEVDAFADSFEEWAARILDDLELHTGHRIAYAWQGARGVLRQDERVAPRVPFVLGGNYEVGNLSAMTASALMWRYGRFARSLKNLPDGARVSFDEEQYVVRPVG